MSQHIDISSDKKVNKHRRGSNDTAKFPCRKKALGSVHIKRSVCVATCRW